MDDGEQPSSENLAPDGFETWHAFWSAQGMPWRREPEIDAERQRYLAERRAIIPNSEQGIYPFKDITLHRADVEWLLATHESRGTIGPVVWEDEQNKPEQERRTGLDVRGAQVEGANLWGLPLAGLRGGLNVSPRNERARHGVASPVHLARADLTLAHLEGADLSGAAMARANLDTAHLDHAILYKTHLEQAFLGSASLQGAVLMFAHLEGADLSGAVCDQRTVLTSVKLTSSAQGSVSLADVHWNGADLSEVNWRALRRLGDERHQRILQTTPNQSAAARTYRQLAMNLRSIGLNEDADRFAYRACVCGRVQWRLRWHLVRWVGSWLLDAVSGYGYKPWRALLWYIAVVGGFASVYVQVTLGHLHVPGVAGPAGDALTWNAALVLSVSAFHGRGFFPAIGLLGTPVVFLAALESVIGLLLEITFIITVLQRFFTR